MTPASMVRAAVACMRDGDTAAAVHWLDAARQFVSFARIHELVNKFAGELIDRFWSIDPALCKPLVLRRLPMTLTPHID